jgi:hypothetical protein
MPHPAGTIELQYRKQEGREYFKVSLPAGTDGELIFKGERKVLSGAKEMEFEF